jgi:hypothetical protein
VPSPPTATAPPPGYAAPAPATAGASGSGGGLAVSPVALAVCVIGAVLVIVSIFLNWADVSIGGQTFTANGREVPLDFLWDKDSTSEDPSLIVALIPAALLVGLGALKRLRWLALVGGILAVVVAVLFGYQIDQGLQDLPPEADISLFDFIGIAPWFALGGGLLGMIGAGVPRPSTSA